MAARFWILGLAVITLLGSRAVAGTIEGGNELSRRLMTSAPGQEKTWEKDAVGNLFFFRYMKIMEKKAITNTTPTTYSFKVQEPSVGMYAEFVVTKKESLKVAETVKEGDNLAFVGRIKTISKADNKITFQTVILRYKDRQDIAKGKELLADVDPNARLGTDTTSGKEEIIKK